MAGGSALTAERRGLRFRQWPWRAGGRLAQARCQWLIGEAAVTGAALPGSLAAPPRLTSGSGWQGTQRGPARLSLALRLGLNLGYRCGKAQDQRPRRTNEVAAGETAHGAGARWRGCCRPLSG